jgi:hypothetical protein
MACPEEFFERESFFVLWLFLFKGGEVLEAVFLLEGFLGSSGHNLIEGECAIFR